MPASIVSIAPIASLIREATSRDERSNSKVIMTAPTIWPVNRATPCSPPAAPLRSRGAARRMLRLLYTLNRPKPRPHSMVQRPNMND